MQGLNHLFALLAAVLGEFTLLEQLVQHLGLVKLLQQLTLELLLGVVDQVEHNRLGHSVDHCALYNVEVRGNQQLYGSKTFGQDVAQTHHDLMPHPCRMQVIMFSIRLTNNFGLDLLALRQVSRCLQNGWGLNKTVVRVIIC